MNIDRGWWLLLPAGLLLVALIVTPGFINL